MPNLRLPSQPQFVTVIGSYQIILLGDGHETVNNAKFCSVLLAVLDPRVGHTMDALSPFIPVLCHSD